MAGDAGSGGTWREVAGHGGKWRGMAGFFCFSEKQKKSFDSLQIPGDYRLTFPKTQLHFHVSAEQIGFIQ